MSKSSGLLIFDFLSEADLLKVSSVSKPFNARFGRPKEDDAENQALAFLKEMTGSGFTKQEMQCINESFSISKDFNSHPKDVKQEKRIGLETREPVLDKKMDYLSPLDDNLIMLVVFFLVLDDLEALKRTNHAMNKLYGDARLYVFQKTLFRAVEESDVRKVQQFIEEYQGIWLAFIAKDLMHRYQDGASLSSETLLKIAIEQDDSVMVRVLGLSVPAAEGKDSLDRLVAHGAFVEKDQKNSCNIKMRDDIRQVLKNTLQSLSAPAPGQLVLEIDTKEFKKTLTMFLNKNKAMIKGFYAIDLFIDAAKCFSNILHPTHLVSSLKRHAYFLVIESLYDHTPKWFQRSISLEQNFKRFSQFDRETDYIQRNQMIHFDRNFVSPFSTSRLDKQKKEYFTNKLFSEFVSIDDINRMLAELEERIREEKEVFKPSTQSFWKKKEEEAKPLPAHVITRGTVTIEMREVIINGRITKRPFNVKPPEACAAASKPK